MPVRRRRLIRSDTALRRRIRQWYDREIAVVSRATQQNTDGAQHGVFDVGELEKYFTLESHLQTARFLTCRLKTRSVTPINSESGSAIERRKVTGSPVLSRFVSVS